MYSFVSFFFCLFVCGGGGCCFYMDINLGKDETVTLNLSTTVLDYICQNRKLLIRRIWYKVPSTGEYESLVYCRNRVEDCKDIVFTYVHVF